MRRALIVAMIAFLVGCNKSSEKRRVIVSYPEQWTTGEYRNCALVGGDPFSNLPHLDCDLQAAETPRSRMFVMDVEFSGDAKKRLDIDWTCQRTKESLVWLIPRFSQKSKSTWQDVERD